MQSILKKSVMLAGAFLVFGGATANAALSSVMEVKVPFAFVVNGQTFPAGQYSVQQDNSVVLIRREGGNYEARFLITVPDGGRDPAGSVPALTFTRDENHYRLSAVWASASQGWSVIDR
jgi:hypothetical protein